MDPEAGGWFRLLYEKAPMPLHSVDECSQLTEANEAWLELLGYTREDVIGRALSDFLSAESVEIYRKAAAPELERGGVAECALRFVRGDGQELEVRLFSRSVRASASEKLVIIGALHNPRLRRAEKGLQSRDEEYRLLVESIVDYAVFMLNPQGYVASWNPGAQRIKGYRGDEIIGQHFSRFYTEQDREAGKPTNGLEAAARDSRYEAEGWRVRKDGSRFWASVVIDAIRDDSGRLLGFAKITRDVTERVMHQEMLHQTQAALAQSQKMEAIGQLTGGVAHDFNNLLTAVQGNLELLTRNIDAKGAGAQRLIGNARRAVERGANLTRRLLAFSRRQALAPSLTDLNRLVGSMSELLSRTLGEAVETETVLAGGLWPTFVDKNQLESALLNLAVNARDAMPDGGKLTIETANTYLDEDYAASHVEVTPGQYVLLAVTDTGTGMPQETQARAFEPFFTTKSAEQGTGLGLSQVYGFVKQSSGHVKIYSEFGLGTTVKIYLPRHVPLGADIPESAAEPEPTVIPGQGETVLVVEDDEGVRQYATTALRQLGYQALEAASGPEALRLLDSPAEIDLMFTDVGLPGMNGRDLARHAALRRPAMKVLFTTGYPQNAIVHRGLLDPGAHVLPKPFTIDGLARKLRGVLEHNA